MSREVNFSSHTIEKVEKLIKLQMLRFARRRRLMCKNGHYLEIRGDGIVQGSKNASSPFATLQVLSIGSDMLAIWGMEACRYLAVSADGALRTTEAEGRHCVFLETVGSDFCNSLDSYQSVNDGTPQRLSISSSGELEMCSSSDCSAQNTHFMWELLK